MYESLDATTGMILTMEGHPQPQPPLQPRPLPTKSGHTRSSRACENCRIRRKKCNATPPIPCDRCQASGMADSCTVREKARPGRASTVRLNRNVPTTSQLPSPPSISYYTHSPTASSPGSPPPTPYFRLVEIDLERMYERKTGKAISLALADEATHPLLSLPLSRPPPPALSFMEELVLIVNFLSHLTRMLSFLSPSTLLDLHARIRANPNLVKPEELAVFYAMLCLGKFRQLTVDAVTGESKSVEEGDPRDDIALSRWAGVSLEDCREPSIFALQATLLLHFYVQATGTTDASRKLIVKAVKMAHALGINRMERAVHYAAEERVGQLYFYIVFIDCYHATLVGVPPLIFHKDYDAAVFGTFNKMLAMGVLNQSSFLSQVYDNGGVDITSAEFVLRIEEQWYEWLTIAMDDEMMSQELRDSLVIIHYHWDRITLRAPCIYVKNLAVSSLAIVARSVLHVLYAYREITVNGRLNLAWPQLRRITTTAYLVIQCFWRRELQQKEAEELLEIALDCLQVLRTRWKAADHAIGTLVALAQCLELTTVYPETPSPAPYPSTTDTTPIDFSSTSSSVGDLNALLDSATFGTMNAAPQPFSNMNMTTVDPEALQKYLMNEAEAGMNNNWEFDPWSMMLAS